MSLSITLDKYNFTLLGKDIEGKFYDGRHIIFVSVSGNNIEPPIEIFMWRSNSDFGFWRLCMTEGVNSHLWKGDDYAQRSLIDFRLQEFINTKYDIIPLISAELCGYVCYNMDNRYNEDFKPMAGRVIEEITKLHKPIELEPFNTFDKTHKCGSIDKTTDNDLLILKNEIDKLYTISVENVPIYLGYNFSTNLDKITRAIGIRATYSTICTIKGNIYCKLLTPKIEGYGLWLYYIHLTNFNISVGPFLKEPITKNNLCIPVALTLVKSEISALGTHSYIVPTGKFICKILDYYEQCDGQRCSMAYNYIGDKYNLIQSMFNPPINDSSAEGLHGKLVGALTGALQDARDSAQSLAKKWEEEIDSKYLKYKTKYLKYKTKYLKLKTTFY